MPLALDTSNDGRAQAELPVVRSYPWINFGYWILEFSLFEQSRARVRRNHCSLWQWFAAFVSVSTLPFKIKRVHLELLLALV